MATPEFEHEAIDRLARIETTIHLTRAEMQAYRAEVQELKGNVRAVEQKVYSIAALVGGIAAVFTYIGGKLMGNS